MMYMIFALLAVAASLPAWRPDLLGLALDDLLQLRCF
jgi:hypothetical protein